MHSSGIHPMVTVVVAAIDIVPKVDNLMETVTATVALTAVIRRRVMMATNIVPNRLLMMAPDIVPSRPVMMATNIGQSPKLGY